MKNDSINEILANFQKFKTSTDTDGNYVGFSGERIFRIVENNLDDFKEIIRISSSIPNIISSNIFFDDGSKLIIEHKLLKFITYYTEWTRKQRVEAALAVIDLQYELSKYGYYLYDPHSFNITFERADPVYFDLGSIKKGKVFPYVWFLKSFSGAFSRDYWDDVLGINTLSKVFIVIRLYFSSDPYNYLRKKIIRYSARIPDRLLQKTIKTFKVDEKIIGKIKKVLPSNISIITNWTDYQQKDPLLQDKSDRTKSFIEIIRRYNPEKILDIGANKGAYTKLAIENNVKVGIAADLDEFSLNILRQDIKDNNLPIYTVKLNLMDYEETPGSFKSYFPAHERFSSQFCICLALVHHICYFGNHSFEEFAERISRFAEKIVIVEFIPYTDMHLTGPIYKRKDRSWYTKENFIKAMQKYFGKNVEEFPSNPSPRILLKFEK